MGKNAARRLLLLDAALAIIAEGGVDAVRARKVAARASVPLGSVSYWFKNRDALIREAFDHFLERNTAFLEGLLADTALDSIEALVDFLCAMVAAEFRDKRQVLTEYELILAAGRDADLAARLARWEELLFSRVRAVLAGLGSPRPDEDARSLVELVRGFEILALTRPQPDTDDLRARLRRLLATMTSREEAR